MKLEEYDEESEGARERAPSVCSADGNLGSSMKGEKFRGGEVASQAGRSDLYEFVCCCRSPWLLFVLCCNPSVKSPLCKADPGLWISKPACERSISIAAALSGISGDGSKGEDFESFVEGLRGVCS